MILQPARVVVIDDNEQHLTALARAIAELGSACLSFLYRDEHPGRQHLAGARLIFCDLHLISNTLTSDKTTAYANIASMLLEGISPEHGPYLLIVWSQYGDDLDTLKRYLEELQPGQRPFAVVGLAKNRFIDIATDEIRQDSDLAAAVEEVVESRPGLAGMLDWEELVASGASRTTSTLWGLCSDVEGKNPDDVLRNTLGRLAKGAAGAKAVAHPGYSVRESLTPLLADQIATAAMDESRWSKAVRLSGGGPAASQPVLYTWLHLEIPSVLPASSRGVVSALPEAWSSPDGFKEKFGFSQDDVLKTCGYRGGSLEHAASESSWYLVQINAACDDGDEDPGYLPYCLAASVPTKREEQGRLVPLKANEKAKGGVEKTRVVVLGEGRQEWLYLFGSFVMGLEGTETVGFAPMFRIRPSLLDKLILDIRFNSARLGVVEP